jgi:hypothetical protein
VTSSNRRSPLDKLWSDISRKLAPLKAQERYAEVAALIEVLKLIASLRRGVEDGEASPHAAIGEAGERADRSGA